ncbi:MAG: hypothetical protein A2086_13745 [Spirochaetes bacterium GWD1_27_9]|nr:MAG: hypothetical protein A2Z98_13180 [Spirochaetes bacterium GWB1_27_13]OHD25619.1 MAG: hypothetical protein A2Y34_08605 [Spirochaetes bacterium GWC1_27_15]OHD42229.1 MAG: hypothetical protein A2086_13745 [Spirochaetes bacterium GWD1_27_9]
MKKFILFYIFVFCFAIYSQELPIKVIEKKGNVDIKFRDDKWGSVAVEDVLIGGTEIFTGFNSQLSLELGEGTYVTINQLSKVIIDNIRVKKSEASMELYLANGFLVVMAKKANDINNKIIVTFMEGNVQFENSGGEIYLRKEQGAIIKCFLGKIKINPKIKTFYWINKNEMCGITTGGLLVENDIFLRKRSNTLPNDIKNPNEIDYYFNVICQPYTSDIGTNDYKGANSP